MQLIVILSFFKSMISFYIDFENYAMKSNVFIEIMNKRPGQSKLIMRIKCTGIQRFTWLFNPIIKKSNNVPVI